MDAVAADDSASTTAAASPSLGHDQSTPRVPVATVSGGEPLASDTTDGGATAVGADDAAAALQAKTSARSSRITTPRNNLVFPDVIENAAPTSGRRQHQEGSSGRLGDQPGRGAPTLSSRSNPRSIPLSARKYAVGDSSETANSKHTVAPNSIVKPSDAPIAPPAGSVSPALARSASPRHRQSLLQFVPSRAAVRGSVTLLARELPIRIKKAARSSKHAYDHATLQQIIAYALVISGMLSEAFTPAPRHNTPLGVLLFVIPLAQFPHRLVVSGLCAGVFVDIYWLLRPQEASFNGYFASNFVSAAQLALAACALVKLWLLFSAYSDLQEVEDDVEEVSSKRRGRRATTSPLQPGSHRLWDQIKYIFPRKTMPKRSHLSFEVLMRVLALVWIHGVLGVLLLVLALIAASTYQTRPQFRTKPLGLPLHIIMLFKAGTTLLSYFCVTHQMSYKGCLALTVGGIGGFRASRNDIVLKYNKVWVQRVQRAKALDTVAGVYALLALFMASHRGEGVATPGVETVLALTAASLFMLELWVPLLILTAAKCGARLHDLHRLGEDGVDDPYFPNQIQWSDEEEEDSDDDSDDGNSDEDDDSSEDDDEDSDGDSTRRVSAISLRERQRRSTRGRQSERSGRRLDHDRRPSRRQLLREEDEDEDDSEEEDRGWNRSARRSSLAIVDANEAPHRVDSRLVDKPAVSGPVWVRHLDPSSGRPFLVHSITGESVWEIVSPRGNADTRDGEDSDDAEVQSRASARSSRHAISRVGSSRSNKAGDTSSRRNSEDITQQQQQQQLELDAPLSQREEGELATLVMFTREWHALGVDSGAFSCRVSRIPSSSELAAHLTRQGFTVVSDGILDSASGDHRRVARLLAPVNTSEDQVLFLSEFTFDSLSLTLRAAFRCARVDAVVEFVRRLQLKEIVGAYSPIAVGSG